MIAASTSETIRSIPSTMLKHSLAPSQQVEQLLARVGQDATVVRDYEAGTGHTIARGPEALDGLARMPQRNARIEQLLDDLQLEQVGVRVHPLRTAASGVADRGSKQVSARPVVKLPVGDPYDVADLGASETFLGALSCRLHRMRVFSPLHLHPPLGPVTKK